MKRSKLITMGISLLAAICLWAYVVTVVNPDGDTIISGIPVTFSGQEVLREDQGLIIKGDYDDMVSVHFYGKNTDLKKLEQYKDEITAVVDVSKVRSVKEYQLSYQLTLPNAVQASAVQVTDRNPVGHHDSGRKAGKARNRGARRFFRRGDRGRVSVGVDELRLRYRDGRRAGIRGVDHLVRADRHEPDERR